MVTGYIISTENEYFASTVVGKRHGGRERFQGFHFCLTWSGDLPLDGTCRGVHGNQVGFIGLIGETSTMNRFVALQNLHVQSSLIEKGAAAEGPLKTKLSPALFKVEPPLLLTLHIESDQFSVTIEENRKFSVGDRRW